MILAVVTLTSVPVGSLCLPPENAFTMDLPRYCTVPSACSSHLAFEGDGGRVANFGPKQMLAMTGHNYSASAKNCLKPNSPDRANCPLRIMCATSLPASVAAAELNDLNVCMGRVTFFMKR